MCCAAITEATLCTQVGGTWKQPKCSVSSQLACGQHGGQWAPAEQWTLAGGVDLLIVGLLQVQSSAALPVNALASKLICQIHQKHYKWLGASVLMLIC